MDWEGPIPVDTNDENTVTVEQLADVLSDSQKEELDSLLHPIISDLFSERDMFGQYVIAKQYFLSVIQE